MVPSRTRRIFCILVSILVTDIVRFVVGEAWMPDLEINQVAESPLAKEMDGLHPQQQLLQQVSQVLDFGGGKEDDDDVITPVDQPQQMSILVVVWTPIPPCFRAMHLYHHHHHHDRTTPLSTARSSWRSSRARRPAGWRMPAYWRRTTEPRPWRCCGERCPKGVRSISCSWTTSWWVHFSRSLLREVFFLTMCYYCTKYFIWIVAVW